MTKELALSLHQYQTIPQFQFCSIKFVKFDISLERFSLDCRKGLVLVLVLLRPLVG